MLGMSEIHRLEAIWIDSDTLENFGFSHHFPHSLISAAGISESSGISESFAGISEALQQIRALFAALGACCHKILPE